MNSIRAFIAIALPPEVKRTVAAAQEQLSSITADDALRWVRPEAMHLTLRFLGQTDERLLPAIGRIMDESISPLLGFTLSLGDVSLFPNRNRPRVLVLNVQTILPAIGKPLHELRTQLDAALETIAIARDQKQFNPHITLGRVRHGRTLAPLPPTHVPATPFVVPAVYLIESDLRPDGPRYTTRHTTQLTAGY